MLPVAERGAVSARFDAAMAKLPAESAAAGRHLLERISTPNWTLEWSLPFWLGNALGLAPVSSRELVLSNVYGLAYVRLHDDLLDDEMGDLRLRDEADSLLETLYPLWISVYRGLFGPDSPFWHHLDEYLAQWRRSAQPPTVLFRAFTPADFWHLAHRGAPLKVCCAAACLLADRTSAIPALTEAIDFWLVAAVLLDHAHDWAADLARGRYNAFVDYLVDGPQTPDRHEENQRTVLAHLYLGDGGQAYYRHVDRHLAQARSAARVLASPELDAYLVSFEREAIAYREGVAREARERLSEVREQLLGSDSNGQFERRYRHK